jgi:hypothetical protein
MLRSLTLLSLLEDLGLLTSYDLAFIIGGGLDFMDFCPANLFLLSRRDRVFSQFFGVCYFTGDSFAFEKNGFTGD